MDYLYILIREDKIAYKVGITNNVKNRVRTIEKDFGKIDYEISSIFSFPQRKLIEQIESGIHAFLSNFYYSPNSLGGGSTEWFLMESYSKCITMTNLYLSELPNFKLEGNLEDVIKQTPNYKRQLEEISGSMEFMEIHQAMVDKLDLFFRKNGAKLEFKKAKGQYVLNIPKGIEITIGTLPMFQWVFKKEEEIIFDIKT